MIQILLRNYGNRFLIFKHLIKNHERLGHIPSHVDVESREKRSWISMQSSCLQHLQIINSAEEIINDGYEVPEEYVMTIKKILPVEILLNSNLQSLDKHRLFFAIKDWIIQLETNSFACVIERCMLDSTELDKFSNNETITHQDSQAERIPAYAFTDAKKLGVYRNQYSLRRRRFDDEDCQDKYFQSKTKTERLFSHSAVVTCRICKIVASNKGKKAHPRDHEVTSKGFVVKESCPEILKLGREEKIKILKNNHICRSCLSLGENTSLHPGADCDFLRQKKLSFLQCKMEGCKYRLSLCDKHNEIEAPKQTPLRSTAIDNRSMENLSPLARVSEKENVLSEDKVDSDNKSARWILISWKSLPRGWEFLLFMCYYVLSLFRGKHTDNHDLLSRRQKTIPKSMSREQQKAKQKPNSTDSLSSGHIVFDPG